MARRVGRIIEPGDRRWLIRVLDDSGFSASFDRRICESLAQKIIRFESWFSVRT
jgi:hypothetical protein